MLTARSSVPRRRRRAASVVTLLVTGAILLVGSTLGAAPAASPSIKTEGKACWYDVPKESRTKERARQGDLTAAHNTLPFGTQVRVTHLKNKKTVVVRIIDRGIRLPGAIIDLSREAAEKLDMIHEGSARVRLEVLPDELKTSRKW